MIKPNVQDLDVGLLIPTPDNTRVIHENSDKFKALLASVKAEGVKIPVIARPHPTEEGKFDLRAGARRHRAATLAKRKTIPVLIQDMTDEEAFDITFIENFGREDLNPIERAQAVAMMLEKYNSDYKIVADKFEKPPQWVARQANVNANLSEKWKAAMLNDESEVSQKCTISHLELIARFPHEVQDQLLEEIEDMMGGEVVTVKEVQELCNKLMRSLKNTKWDSEEVFKTEGGQTLWACASCPKRSDKQPLLFEDDAADKKKPDAQCLDESCWDTKWVLWLKKDIEAKKAEYQNLVLIAYDATYYEENDYKKLFSEMKKVYNYDVQQAKKSDKDAYPCYVVCGKSPGRIAWLKNKTNSADSPGRSTSSRGVGPKDMKTKRAELKSKRWNHVLKELVTAFGKLDVSALVFSEKAPAVMLLVSCFGEGGCHYSERDDWDDFYKHATKELPEAMDKIDFDARAATLEIVWQRVKPKLIETFRYNDAITQVPDYKIENAKAAARLVGIDIDAMFAEAVEAIPEPKSWAKSEEAKKKVNKKGIESLQSSKE